MDVDNVSFWVFLAGLFYRRNRAFGEEDQVFRFFAPGSASLLHYRGTERAK